MKFKVLYCVRTEKSKFPSHSATQHTTTLYNRSSGPSGPFYPDNLPTSKQVSKNTNVKQRHCSATVTSAGHDDDHPASPGSPEVSSTTPPLDTGANVTVPGDISSSHGLGHGKGKRGRPRKHAPKLPLPPLYVFIRNLLHNPGYNPSVIAWVDETAGCFKVRNWIICNVNIIYSNSVILYFG